jgi:hypothetical protein
MANGILKTPLLNVNPGQLITAADWNLLVARINTLVQDVEALKLVVNDESPKIIALIPAGTQQDPIRAGAKLQIVGANLVSAVGVKQVLFDSVPVTQFIDGGSSETLAVMVPNISGLPTAGDTFTLKVDNGRGNPATRDVILVPLETGLTGNVDVTLRDDVKPNPDPDPIKTDSTPKFLYTLRSRASGPTTFTLKSFITAAGPDSAGAGGTIPAGLTKVTILDEQGEELKDGQIFLNDKESKRFIVQLPPVPKEADKRTFKLVTTATSGNVVGSDAYTFTVGQPAQQQDANIKLDWTSFAGKKRGTQLEADPKDAMYDQASQTIRIRDGFSGRMLYQVTFVEGGDFDVNVALSTETKNWQAALSGGTPTQYKSEPPGTPESPQFGVFPDKDASTTGELIFTIRHVGAEFGQTRRYALELIK